MAIAASLAMPFPQALSRKPPADLGRAGERVLAPGELTRLSPQKPRISPELSSSTIQKVWPNSRW